MAPILLAFTLTFESGEASRDFTRSTIVFTVAGDGAHFETSHSGRDGMGDPGPQSGDFKIKDVAQIRTLLEAMNKVPAPKTLPSIQDTHYERICVKRDKDKKERCGVARNREQPDANMKALHDVVDALFIARGLQ